MDSLLQQEAIDEMQTMEDMLRWSVSQMSAADIYCGHGSDNPLDEAIMLMLSALNLPLHWPQHAFHSRLARREREQIVSLIARRINERIPTAYLVNRAWFCGLEFYVDERVLIPRSPIAELIEQRFQPWLTEAPQRIMDLCTGSGCIAIACAEAFPDAEVDAIDISGDALDVAQQNIQLHAAEEQVFPICSDLFTDVLPGVRYDLIVTNPPYVDQVDMEHLPKEYEYEPALGLKAGEDGLALVRIILAQAADYLTDDGVLVCEVGNSLVQLIEQYPEIPFHWCEFQNGGHGVFVLTKQQLLVCAADFAVYKP